MNDGLAELQKRLEQRLPTDYGLVQDILADLRAWLALPPSEDEIAAAAKVMLDSSLAIVYELSPQSAHAFARAALVASRAVLVRPPEETT